jgi:hypothetical protein
LTHRPAIALIPYSNDPEDKATEVIFKAKAGVPYEASINFGGDGIIVEEVPDGVSVEVNGYQFAGPGAVIRKWPLRGVAICPYGADMNTETELEQNEQVTVTFQKPTTITQEKPNMTESTKPAEAAPVAAVEAVATEPKPNTEAAPAAAVELSASPEAKVAPATVEAPKPGAQFLADFGTQGAVWFAEGKSYDESRSLFAASIKAENDELKKQVAELSAKLADSKIGNPAASFSAPAVEKTKTIRLPGSK